MLQSPLSDCRIFIQKSFVKLYIQPAIGRDGAPVIRRIMIALNVAGGGLHQSMREHQCLPHSTALRQTRIRSEPPFLKKSSVVEV
jgi:hypothetical protein